MLETVLTGSLDAYVPYNTWTTNKLANSIAGGRSSAKKNMMMPDT